MRRWQQFASLIVVAGFIALLGIYGAGNAYNNSVTVSEPVARTQHTPPRPFHTYWLRVDDGTASVVPVSEVEFVDHLNTTHNNIKEGRYDEESLSYAANRLEDMKFWAGVLARDLEAQRQGGTTPPTQQLWDILEKDYAYWLYVQKAIAQGHTMAYRVIYERGESKIELLRLDTNSVAWLDRALAEITSPEVPAWRLMWVGARAKRIDRYVTHL